MSGDFAAAERWFATTGRTAFEFQLEAWRAYFRGESGLINARCLPSPASRHAPTAGTGFRSELGAFQQTEAQQTLAGRRDGVLA